MAKQVLVLDEILAMMQVASVPVDAIERFRTQAEALIVHRQGQARHVRTGQDEVTITSGYSHKSQAGFVELTMNDQRSQMDAGKAREIGLMLLQGAEAAISDQIFMTLLEQQGMPLESRGAFLMELRELRQGTRGTSWPS